MLFSDGRGDRHAHCPEYVAAVSRAPAADSELFPVFLDGDLLERFEGEMDVRVAGGIGDRVELVCPEIGRASCRERVCLVV